MNLVVLTGRLTKDIDVAKTPTGKSVVNFTIAVDRDIKKEDRENPNVQKVDFIPCVAWNHHADYLGYFGKGDKLGIVGRFNSRSYEDPNVKGKKVYVYEVIVDKIEEEKRVERKPAPKPEPQKSSYTREEFAEFSPDDLPF